MSCNSKEGKEGGSCSRSLQVQTSVTPLAWTLSTLRQTAHESSRFTHSMRVEGLCDVMNTTELLRQYRLLQVLNGDEVEW